MIVAHQRIIRDRRRDEDLDVNLFGRYWENLNRDIKNARVEQISRELAKEIIMKYEWLRSMPAISLLCYGIFFDNHLGGAVVYSPEYIENLGVWDEYGYTGKIILLSRGACVHWAHPHSASKLISNSIKMLPEKYRVVTATVDRDAGEIGTIYQACNFYYVGVMSAGGRAYSESRGGKKVVGRSLRRLSKVAPVSLIQCRRKERYFFFRGDGRERKKLVAPLLCKIKEYPKRLAN
jgi:hypothetical protein